MKLRDVIRTRGQKAWTESGTLTFSQCGDFLNTNLGATGSVTVTLPAGKRLLRARFQRLASQSFVIDPSGTEYIKGQDGASLGAGVAITLSTDGAYLELEHDGTSWNVLVQTPASAAALADGSVTTAKLGAAAATLPKMSFTGAKYGSFAGAAAAGAITLTGAAVGDRVIGGWVSGDASDLNTKGAGSVLALSAFIALFEGTITVVNQIQQASASDLSDNIYTVILAPAAA